MNHALMKTREPPKIGR